MDWLRHKSDADEVVRYAVKRRKTLAESRKAQHQAVNQVMAQRRADVAVQRDKTKRNKVQAGHHLHFIMILE